MVLIQLMIIKQRLVKTKICIIFAVKLNGGRSIQGLLRGFDPFMNLVIDEGIGKRKDGSEENIGMVVSDIKGCSLFNFSISCWFGKKIKEVPKISFAA